MTSYIPTPFYSVEDTMYPYNLIDIETPASSRAECQICHRKIAMKFIRGSHRFTKKFYCMECIPHFINQQRRVIDLIEKKFNNWLNEHKGEVMIDKL